MLSCSTVIPASCSVLLTDPPMDLWMLAAGVKTTSTGGVGGGGGPSGLILTVMGNKRPLPKVYVFSKHNQISVKRMDTGA